MTDKDTVQAEQLNLKVKSQVISQVLRMEKKFFSRSRALPNSKSLWMPIARDKA